MNSKFAISGTRPPAVADKFYPRSASELARSVAQMLAAAKADARPDIAGVIAPHAGYIYSGPTAAMAFSAARLLKGRIRRAIVIGPAHHIAINGVVAASHAAFATPLGEVPVDVGAVSGLVQQGLATIDDDAHAPEHALEVELPFLQEVFRELTIVPLLFGSADAGDIAAAIAALWTDETLLVVSSDLSHFEPYEQARKHDARTARAIESMDESAIGPGDACGHLAVRGALIEAARRRFTLRRLGLCNSGDTAGEKHSVVGYGAWAICGDA